MRQRPIRPKRWPICHCLWWIVQTQLKSNKASFFAKQQEKQRNRYWNKIMWIWFSEPQSRILLLLMLSHCCGFLRTDQFLMLSETADLFFFLFYSSTLTGEYTFCEKDFFQPNICPYLFGWCYIFCCMKTSNIVYSTHQKCLFLL